jgi:hypothetical protein
MLDRAKQNRERGKAVIRLDGKRTVERRRQRFRGFWPNQLDGRDAARGRSLSGESREARRRELPLITARRRQPLV